MKKKIFIVGIGMGKKETMTLDAINIIENSQCIIGAKRMLECFQNVNVHKYISYNSMDIYNYINENSQFETISIIVSGDVGFFSASKKLVETLKGYDVEVICGISSIQYFCSKLKTSWDDVSIVSLHGRKNNIIGNIIKNNKTFILTGGEEKVQDICSTLVEYGLGEVFVAIGENLSYENERVVTGYAKDFINDKFNNLSVMLVTNDKFINKKCVTHGIEDEEFIRGEVPMTKFEVRSVTISKLHIKEDDIIYDIGAGTGSVSIEMALQATNGFVYAIEKNENAISLIEQNKKKFSTYNLKIIKSKAPDGIEELPCPNKVFIGGSSGNLEKIVEKVLLKNPKARIVINAITLETLNATVNVFKKFNLKNIDIIQMSVAKAKKLGEYNLMTGQNPVFILSADGE